MPAYLISLTSGHDDIIVEDDELTVGFLDGGWVAFYEGHPSEGGELALALPRQQVTTIQRIEPEQTTQE